jgi:hypothetical protein
MTIQINEELARKVLTVVDAGLVNGIGEPTPGKMCVEAAVNYAMGAPHGDQPACVSESLRRLKIKLNDSKWSSNQARTNGLRRLAIAQLGSAGVLDEIQFAKRVSTLAIQVCVPEALRAEAKIQKNGKHQFELLRMASLCESDPTRANAVSARDIAAAAAAAAAAADAASARDKSLAAFCERVVEILIDMKAPGCEFMWLTEAS